MQPMHDATENCLAVFIAPHFTAELLQHPAKRLMLTKNKLVNGCTRRRWGFTVCSKDQLSRLKATFLLRAPSLPPLQADSWPTQLQLNKSDCTSPWARRLPKALVPRAIFNQILLLHVSALLASLEADPAVGWHTHAKEGAPGQCYMS